MKAQKAAFVAAGSAALTSSTLVLLLVWGLLTRPLDVVDAASRNDLAGVVEFVASLVYAWLRHIVELL